jgi:3-methylcrotonyl-CoA carboxylase beta subunit
MHRVANSLRSSACFARRAYHHNVLSSLVSATSSEFQSKAKAMDVLVHDLEEKLAEARLGGGTRAAERMKSKGKKLPRERCVHPTGHIRNVHLTKW